MLLIILYLNFDSSLFELFFLIDLLLKSCIIYISKTIVFNDILFILLS